MKKAHSRKTGISKKRQAVPQNVDDYLAGLAEPARSQLSQMREVIRSVVPAGATEIISYRIPAFKYNGVLVWYAAFSDHCSLFPTARVVEAFKKELAGYAASKGTIHFSTDKPLPSPLIKRIVKMRVTQAEGKDRR